MHTILLLATLTIHRDPFHFVEKPKAKVSKKAVAATPVAIAPPRVVIVDPPKTTELPPKPPTWRSIGGIGSNATALVVVDDSGLIVNVDVGRTLLSAVRASR